MCRNIYICIVFEKLLLCSVWEGTYWRILSRGKIQPDFFFFLLVTPCGLQNLNSPTPDWTPALAVKELKPNHWTPREFLVFFLEGATWLTCWRQTISEPGQRQNPGGVCGSDPGERWEWLAEGASLGEWVVVRFWISLQEHRPYVEDERKKAVQINPMFWRPEHLEGWCRHQVTGQRLGERQE